jgi:hypothetical protein
VRITFHKPWRFAAFFIGLVPLFVFWDRIDEWIPNGLASLFVVVSYAILLRLFANWVSRVVGEQ